MATPSTSVQTLEQIRAAEIDAEEKVAAARRLSEETLRRMRLDAEDAVATARAEAEGERTHAVEAARAQADREAAQIVAEGDRVAGRLDPGEKIPADKRSAVIAAVLGDLAGK